MNGGVGGEADEVKGNPAETQHHQRKTEIWAGCCDHTYNLSSWKGEAGGSHSHIARPYLGKKKEKKKTKI
jgi:hypothetical protein